MIDGSNCFRRRQISSPVGALTLVASDRGLAAVLWENDDPARVPLTFPKYGNVGPAAVPITLANVSDQIEAGQRVLCMGIGSGLNTSFTEIVW